MKKEVKEINYSLSKVKKFTDRFADPSTNLEEFIRSILQEQMSDILTDVDKVKDSLKSKADLIFVNECLLTKVF